MNNNACVDFLDGLTKDAIDNGLPQVLQKDKQQAGTPEETPISEEVAGAETPGPIPSSINEPITSKINDTFPPIDVQQPVNSVIYSPDEDNTQDKIDLAPRSLMFTSFEVEYMKELVPLIGRSPRAVKRFLNCYRLIKVGLTAAELDGFVGEMGEGQGYRATMVLLGIITGTPTISSYVMDELWEGKTFDFKAFVNAVIANLEMQQETEGERLISFFQKHDFGTSSDLLFQEMVNYAPRVSRFSFGVNWNDARQ
jgi:hypothetical protein